jgi:hypothetical protein
MHWLLGGWDREQIIALCVGLAAGGALVMLGKLGLAEFGAVFAAVTLRWAMWQIPPPGRSRAAGTPPDALSRLTQLSVTVLLVTLTLEVILTPAR